MNHKILIYIPLCLFLVALGCAPKTIGTKSDDKYSEDLTRYHPNFEDSLQSLGTEEPASETIAPNPEQKSISGNIDMNTEFAITDSLDFFLSEVTEANREKNSYQGLTIQVYSGLNRTKANEAKTKVYEVLPEADPRLVYEQPNYKVKVGKYLDRLEAQKDYASLREEFPLVLVVPEKFKVVE